VWIVEESIQDILKFLGKRALCLLDDLSHLRLLFTGRSGDVGLADRVGKRGSFFFADGSVETHPLTGANLGRVPLVEVLQQTVGYPRCRESFEVAVLLKVSLGSVRESAVDVVESQVFAGVVDGGIVGCLVSGLVK